jgi:serralysin
MYDVIVRASDGSLFDDQAIAITTTNVNESPTITSNAGGASATIQVQENKTAVTTVVATDPDGAGNGLTYSIAASSIDGAHFTIDPVTGALSFNSAPDYEAPTDANVNNIYQLRIVATDAQGLQDFKDLSVAVTNAVGITLTALSTGSTLNGTGEEDTLNGAGGIDRLNGLGGNDRCWGITATISWMAGQGMTNSPAASAVTR